MRKFRKCAAGGLCLCVLMALISGVLFACGDGGNRKADYKVNWESEFVVLAESDWLACKGEIYGKNIENWNASDDALLSEKARKAGVRELRAGQNYVCVLAARGRSNVGAAGEVGLALSDFCEGTRKGSALRILGCETDDGQAAVTTQINGGSVGLTVSGEGRTYAAVRFTCDEDGELFVHALISSDGIVPDDENATADGRYTVLYDKRIQVSDFSVRYASDADCPQGEIDDGKLFSDAEFVIDRIYYLVADYSIRTLNETDGRGNYYAQIEIPNDVVNATLQDAPTGTFTEVDGEGSKKIRLTFRIPERTDDVRRVRVTVRFKMTAGGMPEIREKFTADAGTSVVGDYAAKQKIVNYYTRGLEFTRSASGTFYEVTGIGEATDADLVIPAEHENLPVRGIGENAFMHYAALTSIVLPKEIVYIEAGAFIGCVDIAAVYYSGTLADWCGIRFESRNGVGVSNPLLNAHNLYIRGEIVTDIAIPDGVEKINKWAFIGCNARSLALSESVAEIDETAFSECADLTRVDVDEKSAAFASQDGVLYDKQKSRVLFVPKAIDGEITVADGVREIGDNAFAGCKNLSGVTLPDSVTEIGAYAFGGCAQLTGMALPCELTKIGDNAFASCENLTEILFPESLTVLGEGAFAGCAKLTEVELPDGLTEVPDGAFSLCKGLRGVRLPESVAAIGEESFLACSALTDITLPDGLTAIGEKAFAGCGFTYIALPQGLERLGEEAFRGCAALCEVVLPNGLTEIEDGAFAGCAALNEITLPENAERIGKRAFAGCAGLTEIFVPDTVKEIGQGAFEDCENAARITVPFVGSSLAEYGGKNKLFVHIFGSGIPAALCEIVVTGGYAIGEGAFAYCEGITDITLPFIGGTPDGTENTRFGYVFRRAGETAAESVPASLRRVTITGGTSVPNNAFADCAGLAEIALPESVTEIGESAFYGCAALTRCEMPSAVRLGKRAFWGCALLSAAEMPRVTEIDENAFYGCAALTEIVVPSGVTRIGNGAFFGCSGIERIVAAKENETYHSAGDCLIRTADKELAIGCKNSVIPSDGSVTSIGAYAFAGLKNLTKLSLPDCITRIEEYAFEECAVLEEIKLPNGVAYVGDGAFRNCAALTEMILPSGVTAIGEGVFSECVNLASVSLPDGLKSIGWLAFNKCKLSEIVIPDSVDAIESNAFNGCPIARATLPAFAAGYVANDKLQSVAITRGDTVADRAFKGCKNLSSVTLPDGLRRIGTEAFAGAALTEIKIPHSVNMYGSDMFAGCPIERAEIPAMAAEYVASDKLQSVVITCGTKIEDNAFSACSALTEIVIQSSVTSIGKYAFNGCENLLRVTFADTRGWFAAKNASDTKGVDLDVSDPAENAGMLTGAYAGYYWKKAA